MKEIELTGGGVALVDDEDLDLVAKYRWYKREGYAERRAYPYENSTQRRVMKMHRLIIGARDGEIVDHINGNRLDNRRENLRIVTRAQNCLNSSRGMGANYTSRFKGVSWHKGSSKWQVKIRVGGKAISLGYFKDEDAAARAYDEGAKKYHGEFARLNHPEAR